MTNKYAMTHSIKNTLIVVISIAAILMSSYVSSSPAMIMSRVLTVNTIVSPEPIHHGHSKTGMSVLNSAEEANKKHHHDNECHSLRHIESTADKEIASTTHNHCNKNDNGPHTCCLSPCSSFFYPISSHLRLNSFSSTLALHQSINIGDKMTRSETLLRPPSI